MRRPIVALAGCAFFGLVASSAHATLYNFSETLNDSVGTRINGSFEGTASGDLITDLSNVSVAVNDINFNHNGALYSIHSDDGTWLDGGAIASFDGLQNNFGFTDVYWNRVNAPPVFWNVQPYGTFVRDESGYIAYTTGSWTVTEARPVSDPASAVPEPASIALLGVGIISLAAMSRRKTSLAA